MSACYVSGLYVYPVKSLKAVNKLECATDSFGFQYDRRFMLIDTNNKFVTQRTHPTLALLSVNLIEVADYLEAIQISVSSERSHSFTSMTLPMALFDQKNTHIEDVTIWGDAVLAKVLSIEHTQELSAFLGIDVRLAYMPESTFRQIDRQYFSEDKPVSFADGYPFLLTSEASLTDLNSRLELPVSMSNFRPNIVISGDISAYAEDQWQRIKIGDVSFDLVKPCSRCVMTTIDQRGQKNQALEPLKTLGSYRKNELGICFGQNLVHLSHGIIAVGDAVVFE